MTGITDSTARTYRGQGVAVAPNGRNNVYAAAIFSDSMTAVLGSRLSLDAPCALRAHNLVMINSRRPTPRSHFVASPLTARPQNPHLVSVLRAGATGVHVPPLSRSAVTTLA